MMLILKVKISFKTRKHVTVVLFLTVLAKIAAKTLITKIKNLMYINYNSFLILSNCVEMLK